MSSMGGEGRKRQKGRGDPPYSEKEVRGTFNPWSGYRAWTRGPLTPLFTSDMELLFLMMLSI